jgi:hypothetical protein
MKGMQKTVEHLRGTNKLNSTAAEVAKMGDSFMADEMLNCLMK